MLKFSDLVKDGVASFEHKPLAHQTSVQCPLCRIYNAYWGMLTDSHLSHVEGRYILTGTIVSKEKEWTQLNFAQFWGGCDLSQSGYNSLHEFFYRNNLEPHVVDWNGQKAIELLPCPQEDPCCDMKCNAYVTTESAIPHPVRELGDVQAHLEDGCTLREIAESLTSSKDVHGTWSVYEGKLVGRVGDRTVLLEVSYDKGVKVRNDELAKLLAAEELDELYLRKYPKYWAVDSDDKKWRAVLSKCKYNKIYLRHGEEPTPVQWLDEIKGIISTIS